MRKHEQLKAGEAVADVLITDTSVLTVLSSETTPAAKIANTTPKLTERSNESFLPWFDPGNDFPEKVILDLEQDYELAGLLDIYCKTLYSGGIKYGTWTKAEAGKQREFIPIEDPEIDDFLECTSADLYLQEAFTDSKTFSQAWAELAYDLRGASKGKIVSLSIQDAKFCRHGKPNANGIKDFVHIGDFSDRTAEKIAYKQIDPYFNVRRQMQENTKSVVYYPLITPGIPGKLNYALAWWNSIRTSKIIELTKLMLEHEYYYLKNVARVPNHLQLHEEYFKIKYKERWGEGSSKERIKIMQEEQAAIDKVLTGVENAGKSIISLKLFGPDGEIETVSITPIQHKLEAGQFNANRNGYTAAKMRALGLRPDLVGGVGDKTNNLGGNTGSSARVASNLHTLENMPMQKTCLAPFNNVIKHVNGWAERLPGLEFITDSYFLATLDQVSPSNRP